LIYCILIVFNLLVIIPDIGLNSRRYIWSLRRNLFFERVALSRLLVKVARNRLIVLIIVFGLNTICMIHY